MDVVAMRPRLSSGGNGPSFLGLCVSVEGVRHSLQRDEGLNLVMAKSGRTKR